MFNINLTKQKLLQKQYIAIISILIGGSLLSIAYATSVSDTTSVFQDVTILGTCTGCGGDGSFTTYTLDLNTTVTGTSNDDGSYIQVANDGSSLSINQGKYIFNVKLDGTIISVDQNVNIGTTYDSQSAIAQSSGGEYKVAIFANNTISIYKNNLILQHLPVDTTHSYFDSVNAIGISPNGKYVGIIGDDKGNTKQHLQIWQGS